MIRAEVILSMYIGCEVSFNAVVFTLSHCHHSVQVRPLRGNNIDSGGIQSTPSISGLINKCGQLQLNSADYTGILGRGSSFPDLNRN